MSRDRVWHFCPVDSLPAAVNLSISIGVCYRCFAEAEAEAALVWKRSLRSRADVMAIAR